MVDPTVLALSLPDIVAAGNEAHPREACGLLLPDGTVFYLTNESPNPQEYLVSGEQFSEAIYGEDGVESHGYTFEQVVVWHTHPSGHVGPSRADLQARRHPMLAPISHMVVALPEGETTYY